jgi:flagellin-like hook-associated protein FlgL
LQNDFNNVLDQIDALAKDASYNGINLLNGDDLKVTFNEKGTSSLTIKGVNFQSTSLGLNKLNGKQFQDNIQIDSTISSIDISLTSLRTQSSKFGANLTTVQTRQDFTKNMINTLQTGSDNLVLADTNEEGANMLALQTRQQLSTTALSLANQASQAVLRLFG